MTNGHGPAPAHLLPSALALPPSAASTVAATAADLDTMLHAAQGQASRDLSLVGQWMALLD